MRPAGTGRLRVRSIRASAPLPDLVQGRGARGDDRRSHDERAKTAGVEGPRAPTAYPTAAVTTTSNVIADLRQHEEIADPRRRDAADGRGARSAPMRWPRRGERTPAGGHGSRDRAGRPAPCGRFEREDERRAEQQRARRDVGRRHGDRFPGEDRHRSERDLNGDEAGEERGRSRTSPGRRERNAGRRSHDAARNHERPDAVCEVDRDRERRDRRNDPAERKRKVRYREPRLRVPHDGAGEELQEDRGDGRRRRSGTRGSSRGVRGVAPRGADVTTAIVTIRQKNVCARQAWATDTAVGRRKRTVIPPSTPCATTAASAAYPRRRTHARGSRRESHTARSTVRIPTAVATMRCPCS